MQPEALLCSSTCCRFPPIISMHNLFVTWQVWSLTVNNSVFTCFSFNFFSSSYYYFVMHWSTNSKLSKRLSKFNVPILRFNSHISVMRLLKCLFYMKTNSFELCHIVWTEVEKNSFGNEKKCCQSWIMSYAWFVPLTVCECIVEKIYNSA